MTEDELKAFMKENAAAMKQAAIDARVIDAMAGYVACNECAGTSGNVRRYDRVRGIWTNGWCIRCDGDQRVFIGRRAALTSIQAKQETAE